MRKQMMRVLLALCVPMMLAGCSGKAEPEETVTPETPESVEPQAEATETAAPEPTAEPAPVLLYQGHASLRITDSEGHVIYIDPYAGEGYDEAADLILVTHDHYDHNAVEKVASRKESCAVITAADALQNGAYQTFDLGYVQIEAVMAYNGNHSAQECVGYVLTLANGAAVYVSGDTSTTEQMAELADRHIDYAFFCCDGVYNMDAAEASRCAEAVQAVHSIPYHTAPAEQGFSQTAADQFQADGKLILKPGEQLELVTN